MKTTVDLPDALMIRAKKRAAEQQRPLRELVAEGLRWAVGKGRSETTPSAGPIRWVTVEGGLPPVDVADRERMHDWLNAEQ